MTASATWLRPAQRVSLIFDDGQRNLATASANAEMVTPGKYRTGQVAAVASANTEMLNPGDKELGKGVSSIFGNGQRNLATAA